MSSEVPKFDGTQKEVPTVERQGGSRVHTLTAHAREQERRAAFVKEGIVIIEPQGVANQELGEAQKDREVAEAKEKAKREHFFADLVAKFPELTDVQREAVRQTMEAQPTRTWSDYDGVNVTIKRIRIEGSVLIIVFDSEEMFMCIDEKVSF